MRSRILTAVRLLVVGVLLAPTASAGTKPTFLYTNNNVRGDNTVSGFRVLDTGQLRSVPGSPFPTGGMGTRQGSAQTTRIVSTDRFLYASNDQFDGTAESGYVSGFRVDPKTGALTRVPGSPFLLRGNGGGAGFSLAVSPNGKFLFETCPGLRTGPFGGDQAVAVFRIKKSGKLVELPGSPFDVAGATEAISASSMRISPDGRFLALFGTYGRLVVAAVAADGALAPVPGSPFAYPNQINGAPASGDFSPDGRRIVVSVGNSVGLVNVGQDGSIASVPGSVRLLGANYAMATRFSIDGRFVFVSLPGVGAVASFAVSADGTIDPVQGSPFASGGGSSFSPAGLALDPAGRYLFAANYDTESVSVLAVGANGALEPVEGSPVSVPSGGGLQSLAVFGGQR